MRLGDDVRGADVAVWRRVDVGPNTGGFRRVAPLLAVEVAGTDDTVEMLSDKTRWYLDHGVKVVWVLVPEERRVIVTTADGERSFGLGDVIPEHEALPGLTPAVLDLFGQLEGR
jgi:Uma2 family endonuclease